MVAFSRRAKLACSWRLKDRAIESLLPFVDAIHRDLVAGRSVDDAVRDAATRYPEKAAHFILPPDEFRLRDDLRFPDDELEEFSFYAETGRRVQVLARGNAADLGDFIELCAAHGSLDELADDFRELADALLEIGVLAHEPPPRPSPLRCPGVTRLQHASLLYRGRGRTVLVDPHFNSVYEPQDLQRNFALADLAGDLGAIVISHSHADHFHIPTLMMFPRDTPIIVPEVRTPSLLCEDMAAVLRELGFTRVIPLAWYAPPVHVDDLEVHALPFHGEQPTIDEHHPGLRNWGNTYVIRTEQFCSWFLIDSGDDATGTMLDVAHEVRRRFGMIDTLLSNLRPFVPTDPVYITGAGHYWLALAPDQMVRFGRDRNSITLGPRGVAAVAKVVEAKHFLPYAHWWGEPGGEARDEERALVDELEHELAATRLHRWRIGDAFSEGSAYPSRSSP